MASLISYIVNYDGYPLQAYLLENIDVIGYIASIYLVIVGKGDRILSWWNKRKAPAADAQAKQNGASKETVAALKSCYTAASTYHLVLCIACALVSCILVPAMAQSVLVNSFFATMCLWDDALIYKGAVGFSLSAAVVVKVVEQLDTFFLVLRDYIVASPEQEKKQVRRVRPSHWWFQVLIALYFWHTYSIGTSCFTMIATITMAISAARNFFYMQQDAAQAQGKTAMATKSNREILALDMAEWISCSALSVYASYMNYTHERGCMTVQANVRMALVMYVTAVVLRFRELGKGSEAPVARESKKNH
ncbi:putative fatty acid elongase [Leishmania major strain Friedlin]|uniref:Elongation of fatty acids protein n=1 Tax=Leishmania major TaxID=5664 RepID=Q4QFS1_LEIMA|nr:putative fatty acid elongase [Leishmania major strain Friedlin]CAG9571249.1 fatty_acid_elongase_-_putative [Leishmania major strain Friedlin]CAJ02956.1 putative fatty acid elongase [Leishmania major strain Friedlin]|eukprot:XP_001687663.1 putative fatty acid elongase [Leishmania major strain Friedlin]